MGKRILSKLRHYGFFIFAPLAVILFVAAPYVAELFIAFNPRNHFIRLPDEPFIYAAYFILIAVWVIPFLAFEVSTAYKDKTGRIYAADRRRYKRTFFELLEYFMGADPHILDPEQFSQESWKDSTGIIFGETDDGRLVKLPSNAECNIFVSGMMGSSKTTGVVIPTCSQYGGSVLAVDLKGDIYHACRDKRRILRFCPDLTDEAGNSIALEHSCTFNPFEGVPEMSSTEKKLYISNMAMTLIPDEGGADGNYFPSRGRKIFIGIVYYLMKQKPAITFPEVLHAILHGQPPAGLETENFPQTVFDWVLAITHSSCTEAKEQVASLVGNNEKNVSGAFDCLTTALTPFSNAILDELLSGKGRCISPKDLESGKDVYLQIAQKNLELYAPLFTMIISAFMNAFTERPDSSIGMKSRPILMVLDEFPQLTFSYKQMNSVLSTLRSKSVQCMIIAQNCSQMEHRFQNNGWSALLGNCNYQLILKSNDELTQKHFSTLFGTKKVLKISNSDTLAEKNTIGRTVQETREPIYQPEDFGDLGRKMCIYFDGKRIEANKIRSWE